MNAVAKVDKYDGEGASYEGLLEQKRDAYEVASTREETSLLCHE